MSIPGLPGSRSVLWQTATSHRCQQNNPGSNEHCNGEYRTGFGRLHNSSGIYIRILGGGNNSFFCKKQFIQNRQRSNKDNDYCDRLNIILQAEAEFTLYPTVQKISTEHHRAYPCYTAYNIVKNKM